MVVKPLDRGAEFCGAPAIAGKSYAFSKMDGRKRNNLLLPEERPCGKRGTEEVSFKVAGVASKIVSTLINKRDGRVQILSIT
jgi:hypothetical protein